ncbi:MAG TPA: hypothetical protein VGK50_01365 [Coriobacteriia bacterium]|jgi:hypothetical protein
MTTETYRVSTGDAVQTIAELLERDDVRSIRVEDVDGDVVVEVPGTSTSEGGARELMERWQDYVGGGSEVTVVAETGLPPDEPAHGRILEEPPEHPEEGEPSRHG